MRTRVLLSLLAIPALVLATVSSADAATKRLSFSDPSGDLWHLVPGPAGAHSPSTADMTKVSYVIAGSGAHRRLTATVHVKKVWSNTSGEWESAEVDLMKKGTDTTVALLADTRIGGRAEIRKVNMVAGTIGTRVACAGFRTGKHTASDTITLSVPISCVPKKWRRGVQLRAESGYMSLRGSWQDTSRTSAALSLV